MNPVNVFLVDDDPDDTMLFQAALKESFQHCVITTAVNGVDALEKLQSASGKRQDVIFMDINMPRMDGRELLPKLKQLDRHGSTPVIVYSTSASEHDVKSMLQAGAYAYLTKPTSYQDLRAGLARTMRELELVI
jgi:CheY-like chemotaxis protein